MKVIRIKPANALIQGQTYTVIKQTDSKYQVMNEIGEYRWYSKKGFNEVVE